MKANFGLGIATGTEGLMYPIPYSSARDVVELSVYAEKLGFHSVWGNDHITTQNYVREEFNQPPATTRLCWSWLPSPSGRLP